MIEGMAGSCRSYIFFPLTPHLMPNDRIQFCWNALIRGLMLGRTLRVLMRCDSPPPQIGSAWRKLALRHLLNVTVKSRAYVSPPVPLPCTVQFRHRNPDLPESTSFVYTPVRELRPIRVDLSPQHLPISIALLGTSARYTQATHTRSREVITLGSTAACLQAAHAWHWSPPAATR